MSDTEDGWIEHDGKGMPVDIDTVVQRKYRDGLIGKPMSTRKAQNMSMWRHRGFGDDIIAYKVVS